MSRNLARRRAAYAMIKFKTSRLRQVLVVEGGLESQIVGNSSGKSPRPGLPVLPAPMLLS
jgi:hypothetical protein